METLSPDLSAKMGVALARAENLRAPMTSLELFALLNAGLPERYFALRCSQDDTFHSVDGTLQTEYTAQVMVRVGRNPFTVYEAARGEDWNLVCVRALAWAESKRAGVSAELRALGNAYCEAQHQEAA